MHKLWKLFVCYHGLWCSDQTDMFDFISVDMNNKSSKLYKWINLINNIIFYFQGKHQLLLHFLTKNDDIPKFYFTSQLYQNMIMRCITTCCNRGRNKWLCEIHSLQHYTWKFENIFLSKNEKLEKNEIFTLIEFYFPLKGCEKLIFPSLFDGNNVTYFTPGCNRQKLEKQYSVFTPRQNEGYCHHYVVCQHFLVNTITRLNLIWS